MESHGGEASSEVMQRLVGTNRPSPHGVRGPEGTEHRSVRSPRRDNAGPEAGGVCEVSRSGDYSGITSTSFLPRREPNLTLPVSVANNVSSLPLPTWWPG